MPKKIPSRMCVSCRVMKPKKELIRVVVSSDGEIDLDPTGRKPGRGAYVCKSKICLAAAIKGGKIDRGLKKHIGSELVDKLIQQMEDLPDEQE